MTVNRKDRWGVPPEARGRITNDTRLRGGSKLRLGKCGEGGSDSLHAFVSEVSDGLGGSIADWYRQLGRR